MLKKIGWIALCLLGCAAFAKERAQGTESAAAPATYKFGEMEVVAIQDAPNAIPLRTFRGRDEATMRALVPDGRAPASFNVFLIRKDGLTMLVDAGNGGRRGTLLRQLKELGVDPAGVDVVLLTHMHNDHIGGLLTEDGNAAFPNAVVRVALPEKEYWDNQGAPLPRKALAASQGRVKPFSFDETLEGGIVARGAVGHTPGHALFDAGGVKFIGDLIHGAALQFPIPEICATYDVDPAEATRTRKRVLEAAARDGDVLIGAHLPHPGVVAVRRKADGSFECVPLRPKK